MRIIVEANIPYLKGIFEQKFTSVDYLPAEKITNTAIEDASALIVRTRTKCNEALLNGSKCEFIGTATIGTDHIDFDYCRRHNIDVASAPGCNAPAVAQYVLSTIGNYINDFPNRLQRSNVTLGVIGVGPVGSLVAEGAKSLGFRVLLNDPPRAEKEGCQNFVNLDTILAHSDIISLHTPLIKSGKYSTYHIVDNDFIAKANKCSLLINAARGEICDTIALLNRPSTLNLAIDCWEHEPHIDTRLLAAAYIGTPHIAGYSLEGKLRGSLMMIKAVEKHFNVKFDLQNHHEFKSITNPDGTLKMHGDHSATMSDIIASYNPKVDTEILRNDVSKFESLRNNYILRHEPNEK